MRMLSLVDDMASRRDRKVISSLGYVLAQLREIGDLVRDDYAEFLIDGMRLPNGNLTGTLVLVGPQGNRAWAVGMPFGPHFHALGTYGERQKFKINDLDRAISDAYGNVQLRDGTYVHGVELMPTQLTFELNSLQKTILQHAIHFLGIEDRCYRFLDEEALPGVKALDYALIAQVSRELRDGGFPKLEAIYAYIEAQLPSVSRQTVSTALAEAGLRPRQPQRIAA